MDVFLKFLTATAWIWGVLMALCFILNVFDMSDGQKKRLATERARSALNSGILAWAWLLARYAL